jgi:hypothetical protein
LSKGNRIVVWNDPVTNPIAARYAWADNPEGADSVVRRNCVKAFSPNYLVQLVQQYALEFMQF